jgi:hypothetical protein
MNGGDFSRHLKRLGLDKLKDSADFFGVNRRTIWLWSVGGCNSGEALVCAR